MKDVGYGITPITQPKVSAKKVPKVPAAAATVGYATDTRNMNDRAAPTKVSTKSGKPSVPKGAASIGYSNS